MAGICLGSIGFAQYTMEDHIYDYIDEYKNLAMQEMELYGVPASITLAQAIYASQAGTNDLVRECHNHFAIMCHTQEWTGETYYRPSDKKQDVPRSHYGGIRVVEVAGPGIGLLQAGSTVQ